MAVEASGKPVYCLVLFYCLDLLALFSKLYPWTLKNLTLEDQTDLSAKKIIKMQKSPKNETLRPIKNASKVSRLGQTFPNHISILLM